MKDQTPKAENTDENTAEKKEQPIFPKELGGRKGPEPTRYGDWEKDGITSDF